MFDPARCGTSSVSIVAQIADEVAGCALLVTSGFPGNANKAVLDSVYVRQEYREGGIAKNLCLKALEYVRELNLLPLWCKPTSWKMERLLEGLESEQLKCWRIVPYER